MLTKGQRVEIIEVVAYRVLAHTEYPTSHEYNAVCQSLITKYPNIKDTIGNGYVSSFTITGDCKHALHFLYLCYRVPGKLSLGPSSKTCGDDQNHPFLQQSPIVRKMKHCLL